jgi:hypothetical protein
MEPERSLSNGFRAMVDLDTGRYRVGDLMWLEFEITDKGIDSQPQALDSYLHTIIQEAIAKSREEGKEFQYLGKQTRRTGNLFEGCLVFGYPGDIERF